MRPHRARKLSRARYGACVELTVLPNRFRRQSVAYPLAGAVLAAGAPLGLLSLRRFVLGHRTALRDEVRRDFPTYAYLAISTTVVFTLLGRALGRYADRLAELSMTDGLTGLLNSRGFYPRLVQEVERSKRSRSPLTLLLLDLDHLKALNDRHGHAAGDRALERIARAIRREMRAIDVGARLGGDEFGLLAVHTSADAARSVAHRLQKTLADPAGHNPDPITASIGVVTFDPTRDRLDDVRALTRAVDEALYAAKRSGRNRVSFGALPPFQR